MKYRSPTDTPIRIALLSGHTTIVGRQWQELDPIFHLDALAKGCECDQRTVKGAAVQVQAGPDAINRDAGHDDVIRRVLVTMIERDEEGDFTNDNLPNLNVVSSLAGMRPTKEDVYRVYRALQAEAEAEAAGGE